MKTTFKIKKLPETLFGVNELNGLPEAIRQIGGQNILLVIDQQMKNQELTQSISSILSEETISFQSHIIQDRILSDEEFQRAISATQEFDYDLVVGFGGWRCIDLAKLMGLAPANPELIQNLSSRHPVELLRGRPVIAVPTTPPNGAEIDMQAIVHVTEKNMIVPFEHRFLSPRLTIIDPSLMTSLPRDLTTASGLDALSHAIDALISLESSPFSEILALQSIALLHENLLNAFRNGTDIRARYNVALGSFLSAQAINMTGSGAIHALAYPLTALHGISHAQATSLMSLHVHKFNAPVVEDQFIRLARIFGRNSQGNGTESSVFIDALGKFYRLLDQPIRLSAYGISGGDLDKLVAGAMQYPECLKRNPRVIEKNNIAELYRSAI